MSIRFDGEMVEGNGWRGKETDRDTGAVRHTIKVYKTMVDLVRGLAGDPLRSNREMFSDHDSD